MNALKIAVASGKGGTGKTMVATSLATSIVPEFKVNFIDCDVEAPNAHLFLRPEIKETQPANIRVPVIDEDKCTACGICVQICEFHALAKLMDRILVFPQLCHGCGSCQRNCPEGAIKEISRQIGSLKAGTTGAGIQYYRGELTTSEPMPTPIINQVKKWADPDENSVTILDSPPGASCSVVATLHDADFVLLVTEPTPFGLHDLKQMLGVLSQTGSPGGVIINRDGIGDENVEKYLNRTDYPILMKIPYENRIAFGLAKGHILSEFMPVYKARFKKLFQTMLGRINGGRSR